METFIGFIVLGLIIWGGMKFAMEIETAKFDKQKLFIDFRYDCLKFIENKYKEYAKCVPINPYSYLLVDDKEKLFKIDRYYNKLLRKRIDISRLTSYKLAPYELDDLRKDFLKVYQPSGDIMEKCFSLESEDEIKFDDLIKIDIIDKTTVNTTRQFTMESKTGDSLVGAFLGDAILGGINGGTIGAIAGAAGKRNITEETFVDKEIAFDIVLYLNRLNNNTLTINVNDEKNLRELVGIFQYILNNKTKE